MFVNYGGGMLDHWAAVWLKPLGTVAGLWVFAGVIGLIAVGSFEVWAELLTSLSLVVAAGLIALYLYYRQESDEPNASERRLFNLAWGLVLIAIITIGL